MTITGSKDAVLEGGTVTARLVSFAFSGCGLSGIKPKSHLSAQFPDDDAGVQERNTSGMAKVTVVVDWGSTKPLQKSALVPAPETTTLPHKVPLAVPLFVNWHDPFPNPFIVHVSFMSALPQLHKVIVKSTSNRFIVLSFPGHK